MWKKGFYIIHGHIYYYEAKVYEVGSPCGINNGRISKLFIKQGKQIMCRYERGWDIAPTDAGTIEAVNRILRKYS